jgi:hypothetical protein
MARRNLRHSSEAWSRLIERFRDLPKVNFFYYDVNAENVKRYAAQFQKINIDGKVYSEFTERDSLMYINIKQRIQMHPTWKTITLSGNIHNMLLPFHGITKMGLYLKRDTDLRLCGSLLSIMHSYSFGAMLDDSNYLFIYPPGIDHNYSGIYFTRMVTASPLVTRQ